MIKNLLTLLFLTTLGLSLNAQDPTVVLPELTVDINEEEFEIDVKVSNFADLISMQYTIEWDPAKLQFLDVVNYNLPFMNDGSFGDTTLNTDAGLLPVVWFDDYLTGVTVADSTTIFTLKMKPIGNAGDTAFLAFVGAPAAIEIVDITQEPVDTVMINGHVILDGMSNTADDLRKSKIQLLETYPNPFTDYTHIAFELKETTTVTMIITDLTGREIYRNTQNRHNGFHRVKIDQSVFPAMGEYIYQVRTAEHQLIGKLIFVK